jgi:hypothetical protein
VKIKITENTIVKKSSKIVNVNKTDGNSYGVLSITLKKKLEQKILFL